MFLYGERALKDFPVPHNELAYLYVNLKGKRDLQIKSSSTIT